MQIYRIKSKNSGFSQKSASQMRHVDTFSSETESANS